MQKNEAEPNEVLAKQPAPPQGATPVTPASGDPPKESILPTPLVAAGLLGVILLVNSGIFSTTPMSEPPKKESAPTEFRIPDIKLPDVKLPEITLPRVTQPEPEPSGEWDFGPPSKPAKPNRDWREDIQV